MRVTHTLPKGQKLVTKDRTVFEAPVRVFGSTVGKMTHFRKVVKAECVEFMDVIGAGRFTLPIPASRRIA